MAEDGDALAEGGASVADERGELLDGLDVVRVDVEAAGGHELHCCQVTTEIARQGLDKHLWRLELDAADGVGKVAGAAVGQVVAVDRGQHNVAQAPPAQGFGCVLGLVRVQRGRAARRLDAAEAAAACARVAHQHYGCRGGVFATAAAPALADVGAARLLTYSVQLEAAQVFFDLVVVRPLRDRGLEPTRQTDQFLALGRYHRADSVRESATAAAAAAAAAAGSGRGSKFERLRDGEGTGAAAAADEIGKRRAGVQSVGEARWLPAPCDTRRLLLGGAGCECTDTAGADIAGEVGATGGG